VFEDEALLERAVWRGCPPERAAILAAPAPGPARPRGGVPAAGSRLRILAPGPLIWERGLEHVVHGVRLAIDDGVDCGLRILGGGEHLAAVSFARHQLGLDDRVDLVTHRCGGSLVGELEAADVLADPAVTDTTSPAPLLAAQAMGVPWVSTPRACLIEGAGLEVPRRDPRAIAEALAKLAAAPALRARIGTSSSAAGGAAAARALETDLGRLRELYLRSLESPRG
jgi:glycosyltransferase involved in cell wall biosynthesis